ncbi:hypothetical protein STENM327S_05691 [Streptomyces tendae]
MSDRWDPAGFKSRVDGVLRDFLAEEAGHLVAVDEALAPVAERLRDSAGHGKRLRAAFCYWGWRGAGQPGERRTGPGPAASMELVHAAAIVHDDLIDDSALRHGLPTAHMALEAVLARDGRPGARTAARSLALLVGDHLMVLAGRLFTTSGLPAAYLARARTLAGIRARPRTHRRRVPGDPAHRRFAGHRHLPPKVVRYKTAKYTVEHPLLIGGLLAGAAPALRDTYRAYGLPLGEAFQLRDDLLGLFGDQERTGKSGLDDLRAHRPTHCWPRPGRRPTRPNGPGWAPCWAATTWTRPICATCASSCGS